MSGATMIERVACLMLDIMPYNSSHVDFAALTLAQCSLGPTTFGRRLREYARSENKQLLEIDLVGYLHLYIRDAIADILTQNGVVVDRSKLPHVEFAGNMSKYEMGRYLRNLILVQAQWARYSYPAMDWMLGKLGASWNTDPTANEDIF